MFLYNSAINKANSVKQGDMVSWNSSGGVAQGKVVRVVRDGVLSVPQTSFQLKGDKDNPAVLIQLYRDGKPTDKQVGHKMSSLSKSVDEPLQKHGSHDQKTHGRGGKGGKNIQDMSPSDQKEFISRMSSAKNYEEQRAIIDEFKSGGSGQSHMGEAITDAKEDIANRITGAESQVGRTKPSTTRPQDSQTEQRIQGTIKGYKDAGALIGKPKELGKLKANMVRAKKDVMSPSTTITDKAYVNGYADAVISVHSAYGTLEND